MFAGKRRTKAADGPESFVNMSRSTPSVGGIEDFAQELIPLQGSFGH